MKSSKLAASTFCLFLAGTAWAVKTQAADENSVKGGVIVNPVGTVGVIEYERLITNNFSIGGRIAKLDYDFDDGSYNETGDGTGVEVLARFYPGNQGFKGFYVGGGVGFWNIDWEWTDPTDTPTAGKGSSDAVNVSVAVGWKIPLGKNFYFDPSITIGNYFSSGTDTTGTQESDLGVYVGVGLAIGGTF